MKYLRNRAFLGEGIAISKPPPPTNLKGLYFMSFYVKLQGKKVLEKLSESLKSPGFFPKKFCMNHESVIIITIARFCLKG